MTAAYWVVASVLGAVYVFGGGKKLVQSPDQLRPMMGWVDTMPLHRVRMIGAVEMLGVAGIILPPATGVAPAVSIAAAIGLLVLQVGAFRLHWSRHELSDLPLNVVLLVLAAAAASLGVSLWA